ncbi:MAG TPA: hypothetical protein DDZ51_04460 [Planctomycetaceae bacterium]|nr:hypothetical protein [Planctomycetaceae bacterium]
MLPRESNVRISIVVPHLGDVVAFEESLVSVLENRPSGAEVWVAHDGSYQDPFDLGDEVRFVTAGSNNLATLVAAAAEVASSRFIHVIGGGVRATHDWTRSAVESLQTESVAIVAPIARGSAEGPITAAGWCDSATDVVSPLGRGASQITRRQAASIRGAYLIASFWRRSELRSACRAFGLRDAVAAEFAWPRLLSDNGWRCELASESVVLASEKALLASPSFHRGRTLRSLSSEIDQRSGFGAVATTAIINLLHPGRLFTPGRWAETIGQASTLLRETAAVRAIRYDQIESPAEEPATLSLSRPAVAEPMALRRAA